MNTLINPANGAFIMRVSLGAVLLAHSVYLKLVVYSLPGTAQFFTSIGLPGVAAYAVFLIEVVAGIALLLGVNTRLFAAIMVPVLLGATWAHWANGWLFTNNGGGWEYPLFLAMVALAQTGLGEGSYALSTKWQRQKMGEALH